MVEQVWVLGQMPCLPESSLELSSPAQSQCSEVEIIYNKQINIKEEIEPTETFWLVAAAALGLKSSVRAAERKSVLAGLGLGRLLTLETLDSRLTGVAGDKEWIKRAGFWFYNS